jgi:hypothetical protein
MIHAGPDSGCEPILGPRFDGGLISSRRHKPLLKREVASFCEENGSGPDEITGSDSGDVG